MGPLAVARGQGEKVEVVDGVDFFFDEHVEEALEGVGLGDVEGDVADAFGQGAGLDPADGDDALDAGYCGETRDEISANKAVGGGDGDAARDAAVGFDELRGFRNRPGVACARHVGVTLCVDGDRTLAKWMR